jgi:hypothetical protein
MATQVATRIEPFANRKSSPQGKASPVDAPLPLDDRSPIGTPPGDDKPSRDAEPTPNSTPSASDSLPEPRSQPESPAQEQTATGRNKAGQFQEGCRPGPGNPFSKRVAALRKALLESVSEADLARVGQKLLALALDGDIAAAKLLLHYTVGKPTEAVDPDRLALDAVRLLLSWPTVSELLAGLSGVRPEIAADVVTHWTPATADEAMECSAELPNIEGSERIRRRRETKGK